MNSKMNSKVRGFWEIDVGIQDREDRDIWETQDKVDQIVGYPSHSSGFGFGYRDLQYAVPSRRRAKKLADEIAELLPDNEDYVGVYYVPPYFVWVIRDWMDK